MPHPRSLVTPVPQLFFWHSGDLRYLHSFPTRRSSDLVTPVFNVGPSGLFKSFFDAVDVEIWAGKPVLLGATAGTPRHSLAIDYAIRPMFGYLKAELAPTSVFAASGDFGSDASGQGEEDPLGVRARRAAAELVTMLSAGRGGAAQNTDDAGQEGPGGLAAP